MKEQKLFYNRKSMKPTNSYGKFNNNEKKNKGNKFLILSEIKRAEILKAIIKDNSYSFLLDSVFLIFFWQIAFAGQTSLG